MQDQGEQQYYQDLGDAAEAEIVASLSDQQQQEVDMMVAANEVEKQKIAAQLGISANQIETLSSEQQEAGAIEVSNSSHIFTEGSEIEQQSMIEANTELVEKISDEEELRQFLASEENRQHALQLAEQIQLTCGDKWFTVDKLVKKSAESKQTAFQKLKLCEMFGLMALREGDWRDGRKQLREQLFKVMISPKDKVKALDRIIQYHKDQIDKMTIDRNLLASAIPQPSFASLDKP